MCFGGNTGGTPTSYWGGDGEKVYMQTPHQVSMKMFQRPLGGLTLEQRQQVDAAYGQHKEQHTQNVQQYYNLPPAAPPPPAPPQPQQPQFQMPAFSWAAPVLQHMQQQKAAAPAPAPAAAPAPAPPPPPPAGQGLRSGEVLYGRRSGPGTGRTGRDASRPGASSGRSLLTGSGERSLLGS